MAGCTAKVDNAGSMDSATSSSTSAGPGDTTGGNSTGNVTSSGSGGGSTATSTTVGDMVNDGEFPPAPMKLDGEPLYTRFMRLTNQQWERAVQDLLALDAPPNKAGFFQTPIVGATDFVNNESVLEVTNDLWTQHHQAAKEVVQAFTVDDSQLQRIYAGSDPREFIELFGRRAYRRPLTDDEVNRLEEVFDVGAALTGTASSFTIGAGLVIEAILQSPHFVYRTELGADGAQLSGYELASKLSFLLRGTTPSDELLDAAGRGELDTIDGALAVATQMLDEPEAAQVLREFHAELFEFKRFGSVVKDVAEYNPAINAELEQASLMFFDRIFQEGLGLREVLTSTQGYVGPLLAEMYQVSPPSSMTLMDLGPERPGYFSQVPFLMLYGDNEHADAIHRGVHLNFDVLCAEIPPPPDAVSLPAGEPGQTDRDRVAFGTRPCGNGCHDAYINPLGFAFENFDGLGRLRTMDKGVPVDTSASYPFADGTKTFNGAPELMEIMASTQMAHACYAKHVAGYALQRDIAVSDAPLVTELMTASMSEGTSVKQLLVDLIAHPAFSTRQGASL
ncbi:MAG TPA: DUF1592 domain-containing protein [Polyangiaceae bacterium]|nr:DUF1592 domain-containing protein [Polyangiaceae bacterium]